MIDINSLMLVNYCHPDCQPMKNIMWLSREEAFGLARKLAASHPETTAFYRFADFENYYRLREAQDRYLYREFIAKGGKPETEHPLSFVLEGSRYLSDWFGNGVETRIPVSAVDEKHISFTLGDSGAEYGRNGSVELLTLRGMEALLAGQDGDYGQFLRAAGKEYVEVQLWSDAYTGRRNAPR